MSTAAHARIARRDTLSEAETKALFGWGEDIFESASLGITWRPAELHLVALDDEAPVGHCGVLRQEVSVGGRSPVVGGVNGVVTIPAARGKGFAVDLLREAADIFANEWRVDFGFLFCNAQLEGFYGRLGWKPVRAPVTIDQPSGRLTAPMSALYLPIVEDLWPEGPVDLRSLPW